MHSPYLVLAVVFFSLDDDKNATPHCFKHHCTNFDYRCTATPLDILLPQHGSANQQEERDPEEEESE
jgi:hypothetical protein